MRATARAQPNIALVKYWGKRDAGLNLPAVGSISITLESLFTEMRVSFDSGLDRDRLSLDGDESAALLPRLTRCLDSLLGPGRQPASIESRCNFPIAAGLASSSSSFAALVLAAATANGLTLDRQQLARAAGRASGSAARSMYGGFVELSNHEDRIELQCIRDRESWPLSVVVAITTASPKPVGSSEAMEISRRTSPFYGRWLETQQDDLDACRTAIDRRDFERLAATAEHNCLKMHSVMWASRPPLVYWNRATLECMRCIRALQADGIAVFFTIDAGPQLKAVCLPEHTMRVREALAGTQGVVDVRSSGLGGGASLVQPR